MKCIDEEIPFELPNGWEWCRLKNIVDIKGGKRLPIGCKLIDEKTSHIYIRVSDMQNGTIVDSDLKYITEDVYELIKNYTISKNDLYLTIVGSTIGKAGYVPRMFDNMNLTENAVKFTNIPINKDFLLFYIQSEYAQLQFRDKTKQVGQPKLAIFRIENTLIPIPPILEQGKIVEQIRNVLLLVDNYSKYQDELNSLNLSINELLKKSILQEAIQGKLVEQCSKDEPASVLLQRIKAEKERLIKEKKIKRDKQESIIYKGDDNSYYERIGNDVQQIDCELTFPTHWEIVRLGSICQLIDGTKQEGSQPLLDAKFLRGKVSATLLNKGRYVKKGDQIMLVDGENSGEVFTAPQSGYMGSTFKQLWVSSGLYLPYILAFILFYKDVLRNSKKGAAIPHLNREIFNNLVVGIPPYNEQKRLMNKVDKLFEQLK